MCQLSGFACVNGDLLNKKSQPQRLSSILNQYIDDIREVLGIRFEFNKEELQKTYEEALNLYCEPYLESRAANELQRYVLKRKDLE
jgi:hypothetical protein